MFYLFSCTMLYLFSCTVFYLLHKILHISTTRHGYLQGLLDLFDVYSLYGNYSQIIG